MLDTATLSGDISDCNALWRQKKKKPYQLAKENNDKHMKCMCILTVNKESASLRSCL